MNAHGPFPPGGSSRIHHTYPPPNVNRTDNPANITHGGVFHRNPMPANPTPEGGTVTRTTLTEAATTTADRTGTMLIQLITPGVGSSGVYTPEVLEAAATARAFPAGTLMFADHPTITETADRPERSIRDVAGVLIEDARWDGSALVAEAKAYTPWKQILTEMKDDIGVSIRAAAIVNETDDDGRPIIAEIVEAISVDFVTKAGRGGAIREVYESARPAITVLTEASANQRESELRALVKAAHATGDRYYVYVIDYDETARTVLFELEQDSQPTTIWRQSYTVENDVATTLAGDPVQVRRVVTYVPISPTTATEAAPSVPTDPAGQSTATESPKGTHMATIQIDEAVHATLVEQAGRVTALEAERDQAITERDQALAQVTEANRAADEATARGIIAAAEGHTFNALETAGLMAQLPRDGRLDPEAFTTLVATEAAKLAAQDGAGKVTGIGGTKVAESWDTYDSEFITSEKGA